MDIFIFFGILECVDPNLFQSFMNVAGIVSLGARGDSRHSTPIEKPERLHGMIHDTPHQDIEKLFHKGQSSDISYFNN